MSTIIDQMSEMPVTFYFTITTFFISFYMLITNSKVYNYYFIPSHFLAGQWWRLFTAPIICSDYISLIVSCLFIIYLGNPLEKKISSEKYLIALIFGYALIIISLVLLSFLPQITTSFAPILIGPSSLIVFLVQLFAHVSPNYTLNIFFDIPVVLIPIIAALLLVLLNFFATPIILGLLYGFFFPDIFPSIIQRAPNTAQNMSYNKAGFWVKKPSNKPKRNFSGKPHTLND